MVQISGTYCIFREPLDVQITTNLEIPAIYVDVDTNLYIVSEVENNFDVKLFDHFKIKVLKIEILVASISQANDVSIVKVVLDENNKLYLVFFHQKKNIVV